MHNHIYVFYQRTNCTFCILNFPSVINFSSLYLHICFCACPQVCTHTVCTGPYLEARIQSWVSHELLLHLIYFVRYTFTLNMEFIDCTRLVSEKIPGILLSLSPQWWLKGICCQTHIQNSYTSLTEPSSQTVLLIFF